MLDSPDRRLVLLRHAHAGSRLPGMDDRDRPLSAVGRDELVTTARHLRRTGFVPGKVIVSDARRVQESWQALSENAGLTAQPITEPALYLAPPALVLSLIQALDPATREVLVIGHNPGLTSLARSLAGPDSDPDAAAKLGHGLATGAFACFEISLDDWSHLGPGNARLGACPAP
jgi:phosphohistidine phosphatase